ncbi:30S ribosomal protein S9 [Candidatus Woesearchaeota archaeon]|nr:30S ribosomal protein S9 [Candidatus Woesearchaeota archaeon]MBW3005691.1 30S ribosomal protein S9 [Candidatus Woesearchaeota archaeon]
MKVIHVSGRRKSAIARATIKPGAGVVRVNSKLLDTITPKIYQMRMKEPLKIAGDVVSNINIDVSVKGGGVASQADAVRLAIARAIVALDNSLQKDFLDYDRTLLIADIRRKETHKPNCHGKARAKRQKSYR